jgi:hypothetical protein
MFHEKVRSSLVIDSIGGRAMIPTLQQITNALHGKDIDALRPARELSRDIAILVALDDYRRHLSDHREVPLRSERDRWRQQRDDALTNAAELMRTVGVSPRGAGRDDLEAAWPEVLEAVALDRRERELLGPTDEERQREEMQLLGRVVRQTQPAATAETAKAIRELMETADRHHQQVVRMNHQIETLTAEDVDEEWVGWMRQLPAMVPRQGTDARPELDIRLLEAAIELGVLQNDRI